MTTYEMVKLADENGKRYISSDMYYQKGKGFHTKDMEEWTVHSFARCGGFDCFIHLDTWKLAEPKELTIQELRNIVGYDFVIKSEK